MPEEFRALAAEVGTRQLNADQVAACNAVRAAYGASYALYDYSWYCDSITSSMQSAASDCMTACSAFMSLMYRESAIAGAAAELVMASAAAFSDSIGDSSDPIAQACASVARSAADTVKPLVDAGESGETRRAKDQDEVRSCRFEARSESDGHIRGYPIVFNELSQDLGGFRERILPTAIEFDEDVRADFNHNPDFIIGRRSAGTLALSVDTRGVLMDAVPPDTQWARDLKVSMDRGDIREGSFAFRVLPGGVSVATNEAGDTIRTLSKILVRKVSVVSDPAYKQTSIEVRSGGTPADPKLSTGSTAGHDAAPSATQGGGGAEHLRRLQEQAESEAVDPKP